MKLPLMLALGGGVLLVAQVSAFVPVGRPMTPARRQHAAAPVAAVAAPAPAREAPGAGSSPEWSSEAAPWTAPADVFLRSDAAQPDLSDDILECPRTLWDFEGIDLGAARRAAKALPACPLEIRASPADAEQGAAYFADKRDALRAKLLKHGALWLCGFDLMKDVRGFRAMHEALGLVPCLDPLHSSGLRKFASERDLLYEEVNKASLREHYIGLHQESTAKRTAAYAAFVCFQRATGSGGRFLVADGAKILADMDPEVLQRLYERQVRISVSNLDTPGGLPSPLRNAFKGLVEKVVVPKFDMDLEMVWEADGKPGRLQAVEETESPINRHPVTGQPVWFCNAHNHLRWLRDRRPCAVPEVGMTDVFYGDLSALSPEDCEEIKRASEKNIMALPMEAGDVLLLDNYRALHGRDVFEGDRYHAVTWFTHDKEEWRGEERLTKGKNVLNNIVNSYMDSLAE